MKRLHLLCTIFVLLSILTACTTPAVTPNTTLPGSNNSSTTQPLQLTAEEVLRRVDAIGKISNFTFKISKTSPGRQTVISVANDGLNAYTVYFVEIEGQSPNATIVRDERYTCVPDISAVYQNINGINVLLPNQSLPDLKEFTVKEALNLVAPDFFDTLLYHTSMLQYDDATNTYTLPSFMLYDAEETHIFENVRITASKDYIKSITADGFEVLFDNFYHTNVDIPK